MTKNLVILSFIAVLMLGLIGCSPAAPVVPEGSLTVSELLGSIENTDMNKLKFVEIHESYALVELNGVRSVIVPDSKYAENEVVVVDFDSSTGPVYPIFRTLNLFDVSNWNLEKEDHPSFEYYVLRDYTMGIPMDSAVDSTNESALRIVIIPSDKMPEIVDPVIWTDTTVNLWIWNAPMRFPWVIQNANTGEIAFFHGPVTVKNNGSGEFIVPGMQAVGVLSESKALDGVPILIISQ